MTDFPQLSVISLWAHTSQVDLSIGSDLTKYYKNVST